MTILNSLYSTVLDCLYHDQDTAFLTGELYEDDMICSDEISGRIRDDDEYDKHY